MLLFNPYQTGLVYFRPIRLNDKGEEYIHLVRVISMKYNEPLVFLEPMDFSESVYQLSQVESDRPRLNTDWLVGGEAVIPSEATGCFYSIMGDRKCAKRLAQAAQEYRATGAVSGWKVLLADTTFVWVSDMMKNRMEYDRGLIKNGTPWMYDGQDD